MSDQLNINGIVDRLWDSHTEPDDLAAAILAARAKLAELEPLLKKYVRLDDRRQEVLRGGPLGSWSRSLAGQRREAVYAVYSLARALADAERRTSDSEQ